MYYFLTMTTGDRVGANFLLDETIENMIGRDVQCHVAINDRVSSRVHCLLRHDDGAWRIMDRSRNGTFVNSARVEDIVLNEGDGIRIGSTEFAFHQSELRPTTLEKLAAIAPEERPLSFALGSTASSDDGKNGTGSDPDSQPRMLNALALGLFRAATVAVAVDAAVRSLQMACGGACAAYFPFEAGAISNCQLSHPADETNVDGLNTDLAAAVAQEGNPIWLTGHSRDKTQLAAAPAAVADAICLPLTVEGSVTGVIQVIKDSGPFSKDDWETAVTGGQLVAAALARIRELERLGSLRLTGETESLRIDAWEQKLISEAIRRCDGNVNDAAKMLGISRATLYRKLEQNGDSQPRTSSKKNAGS